MRNKYKIVVVHFLTVTVKLNRIENGQQKGRCVQQTDGGSGGERTGEVKWGQTEST